MRRQQWSKESMVAALQDVKDGMGVREASRLYNLPYETLRRRVAEKVDLECRPGPPTVLTKQEETELASYCVKMSDMGFGLSRTDVMVVAFKIVEVSGRKHPFTDVLLVEHGSMDSDQDIHVLPCAPPNPSHVHEHQVAIVR